VPSRNAGDTYLRILDDLNCRSSRLGTGPILPCEHRTAVSIRMCVFVRRDGAYRQAIVERRRSIHEVGGVSNARFGEFARLFGDMPRRLVLRVGSQI